MDSIDELKQSVFRRQKILADIYRERGSNSLSDYAGSWQTSAVENNNPLFLEMEKLLLRAYPKHMVDDILQQLVKDPLVSTIDHHGLLNHPFFINSNLVFAQKTGLKYLLCLSTSGVSLNNSSWPGCLLLTAADGSLKRFSFFPDAQKMLPVLAAPAVTKFDVDRISVQVSRDAMLSEPQKQLLHQLLGEMFTSDIYELEDFSGQAAAVSPKLWQKIFPSAPRLVYLPIEELVSTVVANAVAPDQSHILHKLFFTDAGLTLLEKYFAGMSGAFGNGKGSFLFWGLDTNGRRLPLQRQGMKLIAGSSTNIELTPQAIAASLQAGKIYPTGLVCFLVLLYYGLTCLGGFNQVNWLTEIKEKFLMLLMEMGQSEVADKIKNVPTQNYAEGNLAFLPRNAKLTKVTGLDLYLTGRDYFSDFQSVAHKLTLAESIESLLPEIYRVIIPAGERSGQLLMLSDQTIAAQNGMEKKILETLNR